MNKTKKTILAKILIFVILISNIIPIQNVMSSNEMIESNVEEYEESVEVEESVELENIDEQANYKDKYQDDIEESKLILNTNEFNEIEVDQDLNELSKNTIKLKCVFEEEGESLGTYRYYLYKNYSNRTLENIISEFVNEENNKQPEIPEKYKNHELQKIIIKTKEDKDIELSNSEYYEKDISTLSKELGSLIEELSNGNIMLNLIDIEEINYVYGKRFNYDIELDFQFKDLKLDVELKDAKYRESISLDSQVDDIYNNIEIKIDDNQEIYMYVKGSSYKKNITDTLEEKTYGYIIKNVNKEEKKFIFEMEPKILENYGIISFENKYNGEIINKEIDYGQKDFIEFKIKNLINSEIDNEKEIYTNSIVEYKITDKDKLLKYFFSEDWDKYDVHLDDKSMDYKIDDDFNIIFEISSQEDKVKFNFDYKEIVIIIEHKLEYNEEKYSYEMNIPYGTKELIITPQGENINEIMVNETKIIDIKNIRIDFSNLKDPLKISIIYNKDVPKIRTVDYSIGSYLVDKRGNESQILEKRKLSSYDGVSMIIQPIIPHGVKDIQELDDYDIKYDGNIFADYRYKLVRISDNRAEVVGYYKDNKMDKDFCQSKYIEQFDNLNKSNSLKFRFIGSDMILYKITHRTAKSTNENISGTDYDLELSQENIEKYDILSSKTYIVPKDTLIKIQPIDTEAIGDGWQLIENIKVGEGKSNNPMLIKKNNIENRENMRKVFLNDEYEETIEFDTEYIFSYNKEITRKSNVDNIELKYNINYKNDEKGKSNFKSEKLSFPILNKPYEVTIPIIKDSSNELLNIEMNLSEEVEFLGYFKNIYGELIEKPNFSTDVDYIKLKLKPKNINDKSDLFPTTSRFRKMDQGTDYRITLTFKENDSLNNIDMDNVNIKVFEGLPTDGENYNLYYNISSLKGSIVEIIYQDKIVSLDDMLEYNYNGVYEKTENDTISILEDTIVKLDNKKEYYIKYDTNEFKFPNIDENNSPFKNGIYTKKYYGVKFDYFSGTEINKSNFEKIWKDEVLEMDYDDINNIQYPILNQEKTNEKYTKLLEYINDYYNKYSEPSMEHLKNYYNFKNYNKKILEKYSGSKDINSYWEYLKEDENSNGYDIRIIEEFFEYGLQQHLEAKEIPLSVWSEDLILDINSPPNISWKEKNWGSVPNKTLSTRSYKNENDQIITENIDRVRIYSRVPINIANKIFDDTFKNESLIKFINTGNRDLFSKVEEIDVIDKNNEIPMVYLTRDSIKKIKEIEDLDLPKDKISLEIKYVITHEKEMDDLIKLDKEIEFFNFKFNNLPNYLIEKQIGWNLSNLEGLEILNEKEYEYDLNKNIVWSKELDKGTNEIRVEYSKDKKVEVPTIDTEKIKVIGKILEEDKILYQYETDEAPIGTSIDIYPKDYSKEKLYLLDSNGKVLKDYSEYKKTITIVEGENICLFEYVKKDDVIEKEYKIKYIDENRKELSKSDEHTIVLKENQRWNEVPKNVEGYKPLINEITLKTNLEYKDDFIEDGRIELEIDSDEYKIEEEEEIIYIKDNNGDIVLDIVKGEIPEFRFYYLEEPGPEEPGPDDPGPDDPGNKEITNIQAPDEDTKIKFIYDANNGLVDEKKSITILLDRGKKVKNNKTANRDGYIFKGWSKIKDEEELFDFRKPINKDTTVYAIWEKDKDKLDKVNHFEYIQGYPDGSVRPEENITREEVSAVFYRLLTDEYKESIYSLENNFTDLSSKRWSNKHISTLANGGILNGYEDREFKYESFITRAEVATIASRFENLDESNHNFTDVKGHWAEEYIASASKKGWVEGYKDGSFKPDEYITRAEFVTLVNRVLNRGVKKENILDGIKEFKDLKDNAWYYEEFVEAINGHIFDRDNEKDRTSEKWLELKDINVDI